MGTVARTTGTAIFALKGAQVKKEIIDEFLLKSGCAYGPTIIMTESAYMTDAAWLGASKAIVKRYCHLPYARDNVQWLMLVLFGGLKSHENVLEAHRLRAANNICLIKDESNSSHANQGCDQGTIKTAKKNAAESLYH